MKGQDSALIRSKRMDKETNIVSVVVCGSGYGYVVSIAPKRHHKD